MTKIRTIVKKFFSLHFFDSGCALMADISNRPDWAGVADAGPIHLAGLPGVLVWCAEFTFEAVAESW